MESPFLGKTAKKKKQQNQKPKNNNKKTCPDGQCLREYEMGLQEVRQKKIK